jgi:A/G-specific adenine glycosylase
VVAFGADEPVVDGVSARVYRRYFGLVANHQPSADDALWEVVREASIGSDNRAFSWAALDLAAVVCLPRVPRCSRCPLQAGCAWARGGVTGGG